MNRSTRLSLSKQSLYSAPSWSNSDLSLDTRHCATTARSTRLGGPSSPSVSPSFGGASSTLEDKRRPLVAKDALVPVRAVRTPTTGRTTSNAFAIAGPPVPRVIVATIIDNPAQPNHSSRLVHREGPTTALLLVLLNHIRREEPEWPTTADEDNAPSPPLQYMEVVLVVEQQSEEEQCRLRLARWQLEEMSCVVVVIEKDDASRSVRSIIRVRLAGRSVAFDKDCQRYEGTVARNE